jgi:hypothetical protein
MMLEKTFTSNQKKSWWIYTVFAFTFIAISASPALATGNLSNLTISKNFESSTKYFYDQKPYVTGSISSDINGVVVYFDNISNADDYSVTVNQTYPAASFTTQNDCFSYGSQCPNTIPDGTYRVTAEAFRDLDVSQTYVFPKLLVKVADVSDIDQSAPAKPILDSIASPLDADNMALTGSAEADALVTINGEGQTKTQQLTSGNTHFAITVSLTQNAQNNFSVTAMDDAGNISEAASANLTEAPTSTPTPTPTPAPVTPEPIATVAIKRAVKIQSLSIAPTASATAIITNPLALPLSSLTPSSDSTVKGASTDNENKPNNKLKIAGYILATLLIAFIIYMILRANRMKNDAKIEEVDKSQEIDTNKKQAKKRKNVKK